MLHSFSIRRLRSAAPALAALAILSITPATGWAQKPALDHDAYDLWRTIRGERLSADGTWVLYQVEPRVGDGELVVTRPGDREYRVPRATGARFSPDSRFAVFTIRPAHDSVRALKLADVDRDSLPADTLGIMELASGTVSRVPDVRSWSLPDDAGSVVAYLLESKDEETDPEAERGPEAEPAVEPAPGEPVPVPGEPEPEPVPGEPVPAPGPEPGEPEAEAEAEEQEAADEPEKPDSYPLVLRSLQDGREHRFSDVVAYALSPTGRRLAYTASSEDGAADGVVVVETATGESRRVLSGEGRYVGLTLSEDGERLAVLTDRDDFGAEQPAYALYHWRSGDAEARRLAAAGDPGLPAGWWVSEHGELEFSESGRRLYFGTAPRPGPEPEDTLLDEEKVRLDVWHWRDPYIQPMQLVQLEDERERSYRAVAHLGDGRLVQLAGEALPTVEVADEGDGRYALAETEVPYRRLVGVETPGYADLWVVDVRTGDRRRLVTEARVIGAHLSPDGRYAAWYDAGTRHWHAAPTAGGATTLLTDRIPYPVWDEEDDHPMPPYPYGAAEWTTDGELLVYDRFDIWAVDPAGRRAPRRVTEGFGREHGIELRFRDLDPEERGLSPDQPLLLSAFDVRTKESGFFRDRVAGATPPERLVFGPKWYGRPDRAERADVLLYTREDVAEFPDLWVADADFADPVRVSDANPQQERFNWATVELVEWLSADGVPLKGLLYKPEDFDPAKQYPMMVNFYERDSDNLYRHFPPLPHRSVVRPTFYASRGYIVFMPDIAYRDGYPGESAMDAVMPGTLMLAREPWVDAENVGIQGHSWGGYQIAYMLTQTDFFKAAEAGAPVANMTSAYGGIRWGTGLSRMFQYERTQSRIGGSLWEETARYIENSPLFYLDKVETPLLIMHNDEDHAVPWYQGIELFVGLRRLDKPAWMIVYNEEPHWPTTAAHIRDWNIRMQQFFDHFLKGAPAPRWLLEGIPATEKGRTLGLDPAPESAGGGTP